VFGIQCSVGPPSSPGPSRPEGLPCTVARSLVPGRRWPRDGAALPGSPRDFRESEMFSETSVADALHGVRVAAWAFGRFGPLAHPIHDRTGRFPVHHVAKRYEVGRETFPAVLEGAKRKDHAAQRANADLLLMQVAPCASYFLDEHRTNMVMCSRSAKCSAHCRVRQR